MTIMYHATSKENLDNILKNGLIVGSYVTTLEDLADYYAETIEDDGHESIIFTFDSDNIDSYKMNPDIIGIEEPINTVLKKNIPDYHENDIWDKWVHSEQDGDATIRLIGSARIAIAVSPEHLSIF